MSGGPDYKLIYLFTNMAKKEWDFECPQFVDFERELDSSGKDDVFFGTYIFIISSLFFKMMHFQDDRCLF